MYEINVALNGKHLFATHERSLTSQSEMKKCLEVFMEKFPASEGYSIMVSEAVKYDKILDVNEIMGKQ